MTTNVEFAGSSYSVQENETVLDALLRQGVEVPNSCRAGACQCCMMRAVDGDVPAEAQVGLKPALKEQGYFLSCSCKPSEDLVLEAPGDELRLPTKIVEMNDLGANVMQVMLEAPADFEYRPGQFITLTAPDGTARSYSLASLPDDGLLELHIRRVPGGRLTSWVFNEAGPGSEVTIAGPAGECFYTEGNADQPILLVGTGTGLAPLWGIARDAVNRGHRGPIVLYHGGLNPSGLYHRAELQRLDDEVENFHYRPCVMKEGNGEIREGAIDKLIAADYPSLKGWRAFLCGNPDLVKMLKKKLFLSGMNMRDIAMDAFIPSISAPAAV